MPDGASSELTGGVVSQVYVKEENGRLRTFLLIDGLALGVGWVGTLDNRHQPFVRGNVVRTAHNHLLVLCHSNSLSLHHLEVLHPAEDFMLDLELGLHPELGAFFDGERFVLELFDSTGSGQIDDEVVSTFDLQTEREDDDLARILGIGHTVTGADTQGFLPAA